jgi:alkylation response protein AidB-like acyl-CoA dehydrogenase
MDARLTEEQQALRASAARLAADLAPSAPGDLPARGAGEREWAALGELGLLGMRVPEASGGMALSGVEVVLAAEELGRRLVPLPFLGAAVAATSLLVEAGAASGVLEALSSGRLRPGPPLDAVDLTRELRPVDAAAESVDAGDLGGVLSADAEGRVLALTLAALAADLVGVMQAALDLSVAHVAARVQFGVPVGTFQAVQHLAAEAQVSIEAARGLAWYAGWAVDVLDPHDALLAARTAKAYCSEHGREVTEAALQLHGGVAFTWEHMLHVLVRRGLLTRQTLGDEHAQLEAIGARRLAASA